MKPLIGLLLLIVAADAQTDDKARALLMRADAFLFTAGTVRVTGTRLSESVALQAGSTEIPFVLAVTRDGRMHSEEGTGDKLRLQIFDGAMVSDYTAATKTYSQRAARTAPAPLLDLLRFGRDSSKILSAAIEREDSIGFGGRETPCYVVRAAYQGAPANPNAVNVVRTAWIARERDILLRDSWEMDIPMPVGVARNRMVFNFASVEWDAPLSDDLFAFHAPAGSKPALSAGGGIGAPVPATRLGTSAAGPRRTPPIAVRRVAPEYSPEAREENYQGTVLVSVQVDEEGRAQHVAVVRGLGLRLDEKALEAAKQWQFKPATSDGKTVPGVQRYDVDFRLPDGGPWHVAGTSYRPTLPDALRPQPGQPWPVLSKPALLQYARPDAVACSPTGDYVIAQFRIGEDGVPTDVKAQNASGGAMQQAALKAVALWRFAPAKAGQTPVPSQGTVLLECEGSAAAAASAQGQTAYRVGGGVTPPNIIYKVEPEYSEEARKAKYQGSVVISVVVDAAGRPASLSVLRALGLGLDEKALDAVAQWRFKPGTKDGQPVSIQATVEVNFRLL